MKLAIVAATGVTGREIVAHALSLGHDVTAVARKPEALLITSPKLQKVRGDVMEASSLAGLFAGHDAVISSVGHVKGAPADLCATGTRNIIESMEKSGTKRLIIVSALGSDPTATPGFPMNIVLKLIVAPLLAKAFADVREMEKVIHASKVEWTIVKPPQLTNAKHSGKFRTAENAHLPRAQKISRADLADELMRVAGDPFTHSSTIEVAY